MISYLHFDNLHNVKTLNVDLDICRVCYFLFQIALERQQDKHLGNIFLFFRMIAAFNSSETGLLHLS